MDLLRTLEEKVDPARAALVIVDVQNDFCHDAGFLGKRGAPMRLIQEMAPRLQGLLAAARGRGVPVIHVISHHDECYASPVVTEQKLRHGLPLELDGRPLKDPSSRPARTGSPGPTKRSASRRARSSRSACPTASA